MAQNGPESTPARKAEPEFPKKIRTSMEPDREYKVSEAEYVDLTRQGLIVKDGK